MDKVNQRLNSWKAKYLPFAGFGLKKAKDVNHAFSFYDLSNWRLCSQSQSLWSSVTQISISVAAKIFLLGSNFQRGLCGSWDPFHQQLIWRDCQVPNIRALHQYKQNRLSTLDVSGGWNVNLQIALKIEMNKRRRERKEREMKVVA